MPLSEVQLNGVFYVVEAEAPDLVRPNASLVCLRRRKGHRQYLAIRWQDERWSSVTPLPKAHRPEVIIPQEKST